VISLLAILKAETLIGLVLYVVVETWLFYKAGLACAESNIDRIKGCVRFVVRREKNVVFTRDFGPYRDPVWERACSRRGRHIHLIFSGLTAVFVSKLTPTGAVLTAR
jgi:hypothetical protein